MLSKSFFILLILSLPSAVRAQPAISSVSGSCIHDSTLTITGSGFGSKTPAQPLLWDDCTTSPPLSSHYDLWLPTEAEQGSMYNMSYRDSGFRGINTPHTRIHYFLGGAHAVSQDSGGYYRGGIVGLGKNTTSHSYFVSYYYRVDPDFDEEANSTYGDNMKELVLSNTPGDFYPDGWGAFGYSNWCNSDVPDVNMRTPIKMSRMPITPANQALPYGCSGNYISHHNNPINGWVKMQWEGNYNHQFDGPQIKFTTYPDGTETYRSHYGDGLTVSEHARGPWANFPKENDLRFIGIGGFARVKRENNGVNSFRYFASVYLDSTRARVMLGDNQNYEACTVMEPQIPSSWSTASIQCRVNLGALPDSGTAYLFIFDAQNNRNPTGFPVTIGTSSGDTTPPEAPRGFKIVENLSRD